MITPFAVYDVLSGKILRTGSATRDTAKLQAGVGEAVLLSEAQFDLHYVYGGVLVNKPIKPSAFHQFDYSNKRWELSAPLALIATNLKRSRLLAESDWVVTRASEGGTPVPTPWVSYRQALRDVTLQADPFNIVWPVVPT